MDKFLQLAPMQAMTDVIFMNTYHRIFGGFTEMMAPYLTASSKSFIKPSRIDRLYGELNSDIVMIPQLLCNEAEGFLHYANTLFDKGFETINWNLGCPFPTVTKKTRGAGLLAHPEIIEKVLKGLNNKLKPQLSIKIRLGFNSNKDILPIIDLLNDYPVKELIIHPRTAEQKYEGLADKEYFGKIYEKVKAPVVYNGDIVRSKQVDELENLFSNLKGYMIGRGAFINPFITSQINGNNFSDTEKREKYEELYFTLHNYYKAKTKDDFGFLCRMKELWMYFSQSFKDGESYFNQLKTINDISAFEDTVKPIFEKGQLLY